MQQLLEYLEQSGIEAADLEKLEVVLTALLEVVKKHEACSTEGLAARLGRKVALAVRDIIRGEETDPTEYAQMMFIAILLAGRPDLIAT